jgi:hypothetical protein
LRLDTPAGVLSLDDATAAALRRLAEDWKAPPAG